MNRIYILLLITVFVGTSSQCTQAQGGDKAVNTQAKKVDLGNYEKAYFASGCFWCVEAIFESVEGVEEVISGYSGGSSADANYSAVSAGVTDHAEAVEVYYNPEVVNYETLLEVFFGSHNPETLNKQGPDAGRQYRSAIFYNNDEEKKAADAYIKELLGNKVFDNITTQVVELEKFYDAEDYHQDYERKNPNQGYVRAVSVPRLRKFQKAYPGLLKKDLH